MNPALGLYIENVTIELTNKWLTSAVFGTATVRYSFFFCELLPSNIRTISTKCNEVKVSVKMHITQDWSFTEFSNEQQYFIFRSIPMCSPLFSPSSRFSPDRSAPLDVDLRSSSSFLESPLDENSSETVRAKISSDKYNLPTHEMVVIYVT